MGEGSSTAPKVSASPDNTEKKHPPAARALFQSFPGTGRLTAEVATHGLRTRPPADLASKVCDLARQEAVIELRAQWNDLRARGVALALHFPPPCFAFSRARSRRGSTLCSAIWPMPRACRAESDVAVASKVVEHTYELAVPRGTRVNASLLRSGVLHVSIRGRRPDCVTPGSALTISTAIDFGKRAPRSENRCSAAGRSTSPWASEARANTWGAKPLQRLGEYPRPVESISARRAASRTSPNASASDGRIRRATRE